MEDTINNKKMRRRMMQVKIKNSKRPDEIYEAFRTRSDYMEVGIEKWCDGVYGK